MSEKVKQLPYEDNGEPEGLNATLTSPIAADGRPEPGKRYIVPARQGRAVRLAQGQRLKIINTYGSQVCDFWAFNASSPREFLSMEHLRTWLSRLTPVVGDPLVTNHRRTILTFLEDTSPGVHDTLLTSCDIYRYQKLGVEGYHDNCADNLRMALKAIKLRTAEVPSPLNLWMNNPVQADGSIGWLTPVSKPDDYVVFGAEMDCIVVMSACPQDLVPVNGKDCQPADLHFEVI
ncbi:urea carboxylase-associated family protein [Ktedonosporobacter rubrisoli]|uniref:Urea carboxylase-associated family protein n=1 Tax=Ktedonosporobacter rubrisoli TaxID=2509675 RepID=A0A4P6JWC8_KTERU|nr:urea carboxylase-associated family protein [Ktedonosporobacter rubrisoli]QBD79874.1 urea carboxylase-associated family protein [Ktedonosporobacter rubrisoli]